MWNSNKIISDAERVVKLFQKYFSDDDSMNMLENIHELQ